MRSFLIHPGSDDVVYVLTSSGGLWKTTNFTAPRPGWRAMTDSILSTSGGGAALGKNPETIYLGTGDPFDPGVGGYAYTSTDGGDTWSNGVKLGASTVVPDVKVDTTGATDVILMGTNTGLFRSTDGGTTYTPVLSGVMRPVGVCFIGQHRDRRGRYTGRVDKNGDAGLERIKHLETQLSRAPIRSGRHRLLAKAIRIEAKLYRKSLDIAQASNRPARNPGATRGLSLRRMRRCRNPA